MKVTLSNLRAGFSLPLAGRPFLHEQGNTVMRGWIEAATITDTHWAITGRNMEYLDKYSGRWIADDVNDFAGTIDQTCLEIDDTGMVEIDCYGSVYHIAPPCEAPWAQIDWPELDGYDGGPMETGDAAP